MFRVLQLQCASRQCLEGTLRQDMTTLSAYLQTWRLKLSHTKTVTAAFHLNNREAKRELKVYSNHRLLPFCPTPTLQTNHVDFTLPHRSHVNSTWNPHGVFAGYLPWGKTRQIAHVLSPSSGIAQKTIFARHTIVYLCLLIDYGLLAP